MKSRTHKIIITAIAVLQLIAIASLVYDSTVGQAAQDAEIRQLLSLMTTVMQTGIIVTDYELSQATGQVNSDQIEYYESRDAVLAGIASMEKVCARNAQKLELYQQQKKLVFSTDRVVQKMKDAIDNRSVARSDRYGIVLIIMTGMRKFSSLAHKIVDNFELLAQATAGRGSSPAPLVAGVANVLSLLLVGVLVLKPQSQI